MGKKARQKQAGSSMIMRFISLNEQLQAYGEVKEGLVKLELSATMHVNYAKKS